MEFERDYYAVLGVPPDADARAIKQAYRQLALRYHPDTSTEVEAAQRFIEIQEAYDLLVDPLQREAFDHWRRQQGLDRPLGLQLRLTPSQTILPCLNESQTLYVLVELWAATEAESERLPLNLALVLDRSTSMKGARLQHVKEAARSIVDQMGPQDILSLVVFSDRAQVILPGQPRLDKAAARSAINVIRAGGGTELLQGLRLGLQEVQRWHSERVHSHLILLTDGRTYGDEEDCLQEAQAAGQEGIALTMMGVGEDWNEQLLDQIASLSQGTSVYIDSSAKIAEVFCERLQSLSSVFAQNLELSLHLGERVTLQQAFFVSPEISHLRLFDNTVALPALEKHQPQAILLELLLAQHDPGEHRLLQIGVEGLVPALGSQPVRVRQALSVAFETDLHRQEAVPPDIVSAVAKSTIFRMQERAMAEAERGQIGPAVDRLKALATRLLDIGEAELARAALLEAGRLANTGSLSAKGMKQIRYGTRGLTILPKEVRYD